MQNSKSFKTTKSIILTALIVLGSLFTSCSSDNDENASIVGTWKSSSVVVESFKDGVSQGKQEETVDANNYTIFTFKADGTFSENRISSGKDRNSTEVGEYEIKDNVISIKYDGNSDFDVANFTVTNSKLVLSNTEEYTLDVSKYKAVFTITFSRQ